MTNQPVRPRRPDSISAVTVVIFGLIVVLLVMIMIGIGYLLTPIIAIAALAVIGILHYAFWGRRWLRRERSPRQQP